MRKPKKPPPSPFKVKLEMFAATKGWSLRELAGVLGVPPSTFADYANTDDPSEIPAGVIVRLAAISQASPAYWLNDKIATYPPPMVVAERDAELLGLLQALDVRTGEWARGVISDEQRRDRVRRIDDAASGAPPFGEPR